MYIAQGTILKKIAGVFDQLPIAERNLLDKAAPKAVPRHSALQRLGPVAMVFREQFLSTPLVNGERNISDFGSFQNALMVDEFAKRIAAPRKPASVLETRRII